MKVYNAQESTVTNNLYFSMDDHICYTNLKESQSSNSIKIGSLILTCGIVSSVHISNNFLPKDRILPALCSIHNIEGISVNVPVKLYMHGAMPLCNLIQKFYLSSSVVNE